MKRKKNTKENEYIVEKQRRKKGKKKSGIGKRILLVILMLLLVLVVVLGYKIHKNGGGLKGFLATAVGHDENTLKNLPKFYCLLLGESENLTDTIMIAEYDPKNQQASIMSIPRDTFIGNNRDTAEPIHKINAVYQTGAENVLREVNELTGLELKYYLAVDTKAFREIVDAIGGVEFNVPIDMKYDDKRQNLHINLKAGKQLLDGDKAEQLVRFRHNNDTTTYPASYGTQDDGRMRTQREFLTALAKKVLKPENLLKINDFIEIGNKYIQTNLDFNILKDYAPYLVEFNVEDLKTAAMPGAPEKGNGYWFYFADEEKLTKLIDEMFLNPTSANSTSQEGIESEGGQTGNTQGTAEGSEGGANSKVVSSEKSKIQIEVLNGTKSNSKLEKIVSKLKEAGYTVSKVGNTTDTKTTTVIERDSLSNEIKEEIKTIVGKENIQTGQSTAVDITIIIGKDYE